MADQAPTIRHINYAQKVKEQWGEEWNQPDPAYEWSSGRVFKDSGPNSGIYDPLDER